MKEAPVNRLSQRSDYTYKFNRKTGRHGWLRLTPAHSVRVVEELLGQAPHHSRVLDPFCGTATTALSAAYRGQEAVTVDINPFLVWLGRVKTQHYTEQTINLAYQASEDVILEIYKGAVTPISPPPIHRIERWWSPRTLEWLCQLRGALDQVAPFETDEGALLRVAFCRTLMACSNAAFNHQSISFKSEGQQLRLIQPDYAELFREDVSFVLAGARENPAGKTRVILHDARRLSTLSEGTFDLVITSPPYVNRISYVRELRPYMYWLGFLSDGRQAGELDWLAIGGTWGVATSRLASWKAEQEILIAGELETLLERIAKPSNANGRLLAAYIRKYFLDIETHLSELRSILNPGAIVHYIVGNSTFYGELLPVERLYASLFVKLGFKSISVHPLRKRNSKKELVEFDVSATI